MESEEKFTPIPSYSDLVERTNDVTYISPCSSFLKKSLLSKIMKITSPVKLINKTTVGEKSRNQELSKFMDEKTAFRGKNKSIRNKSKKSASTGHISIFLHD